MYNVNYQDTLNELKQSICEVTFTKVNGDTRVMTCTLQKDLIPQATKKDPLTETKVREINENFISFLSCLFQKQSYHNHYLKLS